jgi:hypothetical protein
MNKPNYDKMTHTQKKTKKTDPIPMDRILKFIKDDLSSNAINQINSLVRRRDYTKNHDLYNEKIKEVFLHELRKEVHNLLPKNITFN